MAGPLRGIRVLEFSGIGPGPFCGMLLADLGADVVRLDGPRVAPAAGYDITGRGKRSVALDLKDAADRAVALDLVARADLLIEGYRPGVMERLGLGPDVALARNPRLVYGRMTGWGQAGPYAQSAGHDINYISLTGALHAIGGEDAPTPPLNLLGDYAGGSMYLAMGLLAGLLHARATGEGQVVDCAMIDGAASLMAIFYALRHDGTWADQRRSNVIDGGAHFYGTYQCRDGAWISVGAIEPQFYALFLQKAGLADDPAFRDQWDRGRWPELRARLAEVIRTKIRQDWLDLMDGTDACVAPVLSLSEAPGHPQNAGRSVFVTMDGVVQPGPAPRFSRTAGGIQGPPPAIGAHTGSVLQDWDVPSADRAQ